MIDFVLNNPSLLLFLVMIPFAARIVISVFKYKKIKKSSGDAKKEELSASVKEIVSSGIVCALIIFGIIRIKLTQ